MFARLPSLNSFRAFEAAARLRSFKAAAAELYVTPTAISHQIRQLEAQMGTLLFERKTRSVALTQEGEALLAVTHQALKQLQSGVDSIRRQASTITVSTTSAFASLWLVPRLEDFRQQHPALDVVLKTSESKENIEHDRRFDVAIRYGHCPASDPQSVLLYRETLCCVASASYCEQTQSAENAIIYTTRWQNTDLPSVEPLLNSLPSPAAASVKLRYFDQETHTVQAALASQGAAFVSTLLIQQPLREKWLIPHPALASLQQSGLEYYAVIPDRHRQTAAVQQFVVWLRQMLTETESSSSVLRFSHQRIQETE
ncbi:LysR substrate-binding domain-containing protein [Photobacterium sp. TLY01]|uniref:LysR substrate-binding domain-containing protein n=1 Tax=Photobacterium sp. TLY01 TaxID=2907534 RepID=UPI001F29E6C2|nr:LysR substrate-binding domain-containing protein [Photobacterium sp. TLY01]UIP29739.1 LysR substrate-binding domain-containing protein [Photobacterium sp. TLY01]